MKRKVMYLMLFVVVASLSVSAQAELPTQWMNGYYGLKGDGDTVALWHQDNSYVDNIDKGHNFTTTTDAAFVSGNFNGGVDLSSATSLVSPLSWDPTTFIAEAWIDLDAHTANARILDHTGFRLAPGCPVHQPGAVNYRSGPRGTATLDRQPCRQTQVGSAALVKEVYAFD